MSLSSLDRKSVNRRSRLLGQEIRTLVNEPKPAGYFTVHWDGKDNHGQEVPSGVCLYRIQAQPARASGVAGPGTRSFGSGNFVHTKKMLLMR